jgi:hypothetical protein
VNLTVWSAETLKIPFAGSVSEIEEMFRRQSPIALMSDIGVMQLQSKMGYDYRDFRLRPQDS